MNAHQRRIARRRFARLLMALANVGTQALAMAKTMAGLAESIDRAIPDGIPERERMEAPRWAKPLA